MIDVHCHILPAIDDGAVDVDDSAGMARQAVADGIERICATPHIRHDHDVRIAELARRVGEVNDELRGRGIAVEVIQGGEVAETALPGLADDELGAVALGGRWVLLEPAPGPLSDSLSDAVAELDRRGFASLIAHPERHVGPDFADRLAGLVTAGALVQMTAALFVEGPAADAMLGLAARGLVHVLGSDAHSSHVGRPVALSAGLERLKEVEALRPHLDWISHEAPERIVRGQDVDPPYAAV